MTTLQTETSQDIFAPIEKDLDRVVEVITQLSIEEIERCPAGIDALDTLDERLAHVMATPGKKMRPAMTLLASKLWGATPDEKVISMAVAVELLHIAALIHDDTVDDADVRRGKATAGFLWGNNFAVLLGDYVFATSAKIRLCNWIGQIDQPLRRNDCRTRSWRAARDGEQLELAGHGG